MALITTCDPTWTTNASQLKISEVSRHFAKKIGCNRQNAGNNISLSLLPCLPPFCKRTAQQTSRTAHRKKVERATIVDHFRNTEVVVRNATRVQSKCNFDAFESPYRKQIATLHSVLEDWKLLVLVIMFQPYL